MSVTSIAGTDRAALEAARRHLASPSPGIAERLALAEACFRLAVLPKTDPEEAIALMREAALHDPFHPKVFFHLGRLLHLNGDPQNAIFEYRKALTLAPRSHRTYVHLALALNELEREERELGMRTMAALAGGDGDALAKMLADLDALIVQRTTPESERKKMAKPPEPDAQEAPPAPAGGPCRWRGIWKLLLFQEMGQQSPQNKKVSQQLDQGKQMVADSRGVAEYLVSCMAFVLDGRALCRQLEARLREPKLASLDRPSVRLARAVCDLSGKENVEAFVDQAAELMAAGEIPAELVCCLHLSWYGKNPNADPVAAAEAVDRYPVEFRSLPCFRELKMAVLDHFARLAWAGERLDHAGILWQESAAVDPMRVAVAHNLALTATRAKAEEVYERAWERATELRYLLAAAAGDVRVELDDRLRLHRSFAGQSRVRYLAKDAGSRDEHTDAELLGWMEDFDAFTVWLRESELADLNARLRLQSPLHLLGLERDCSEEDADAAPELLTRSLAVCYKGRRWAGMEVFQDLVKELAAQSCVRAKDPIERKRDAYFDLESTEAQRLTRESMNRGFLIFKAIRLAAKSPKLKVKRSGLEAVRYLLNMPWRLLEPACKKIGMLDADADLMEIFTSHATSLVLDTAKVPAEERLSIVEDVILALPNSLNLRLLQCRLLLDMKRHREAYAAALAGFEVLGGMKGGEAAARFERQFVVCVDNAALAQMPDHLMQPKREQIGEFEAAVRRVLKEFPRAGGLRLMAANLLIQVSGEDPAWLTSAAALLQEGLDQLLTAEQVQEARQLLEKAGAKSEAVEALARVRQLLESAAARAKSAVEAWRAKRTPAEVRHAIDSLEAARAEAEQAEELAAASKLGAAADKARALIADIRKLREEIEKG